MTVNRCRRSAGTGPQPVIDGRASSIDGRMSDVDNLCSTADGDVEVNDFQGPVIDGTQSDDDGNAAAES